MKIFVAGASGAIGRPLIDELRRAGHSVVGMTQSPEGATHLRQQGCEAVIADALDAGTVESAVRSAHPEILIDQLTSLPKDPDDFAAAQQRDTKLRLEGGANLLRAAEVSGVRRFLQQSSGYFLKTNGGELADEHSSFVVEASPGVTVSAEMYTKLEALVLSSPLESVILRYGFFYGRGTWYEPNGGYASIVRQQKLPIIGDGVGVWSWIHIDDAAQATVAALGASTGVYNIVDSYPSPGSVWLPAFAASVGAPPPSRRTEADALDETGADAVFYGTKLRGATNEKAKRVLGFRPRRLEWLPAEVLESV
jgi:nucleoside-diphosphate-sugar epimerase